MSIGVIGEKRPESRHPNSLSYSFSRGTRERIYKAVNTSKRVKKKYIPNETPGPSQYFAETMVLKPKSPCMKMTHAKRFQLPGKFFVYKSNV